MRLGIERLAIDNRKIGALDMGDEMAVRTARNDRDLHARFTQRGQVLGQLEFLTRIRSGQNLDRRQLFLLLAAERLVTRGRNRGRRIDLSVTESSTWCRCRARLR